MSQPSKETKKHFIIPKIILLLYCIIAIISVAYILNINIFPYKNEKTDISARIRSISTDLSSTSMELLDIQRELEARIETVEKLKAEAEQAEHVISLSDEQVSAIQAKIHQEVDSNSNKSLLQNILISLVFFILGLVGQPVFRIAKGKFNKPSDNYKAIRRGRKPSSDKDQTTIYTDKEIEAVINLLNIIKQQQSKR